jgi:hypothetical protein
MKESAQEERERRSAFVRGLVQRTRECNGLPAALSTGPRRTIVQFWDDIARLPGDVRECIESWRRLRARGLRGPPVRHRRSHAVYREQARPATPEGFRAVLPPGDAIGLLPALLRAPRGRLLSRYG